MFDINEVYDTIDNYKSYITFATAYCKVNELKPPFPGTVVRVRVDHGSDGSLKLMGQMGHGSRLCDP